MPARKAPCPQCVATKNDGSHRCKIRTCKYHPKCWIHTQKQDGLKIDKSGIRNAGQGLYTLKPIDAHKKIANYTGERISGAELRKRYGKGTGKYTVRVGATGTYIDAAKQPSGMARWANDPRGSGKQPNARLEVNTHSLRDPTAKVRIVSTKKIDPEPETNSKGKRESRKEILVKYGSNYWKGKGKGKSKNANR